MLNTIVICGSVTWSSLPYFPKLLLVKWFPSLYSPFHCFSDFWAFWMLFQFWINLIYRADCDLRPYRLLTSSIDLSVHLCLSNREKVSICSCLYEKEVHRVSSEGLKCLIIAKKNALQISPIVGYFQSQIIQILNCVTKQEVLQVTFKSLNREWRDSQETFSREPKCDK